MREEEFDFKEEGHLEGSCNLPPSQKKKVGEIKIRNLFLGLKDTKHYHRYVLYIVNAYEAGAL